MNIVNVLMFEGKAEEAMNFYVKLFGEGSAVGDVHRYGPENPEAEGKIVHARFTLAGREYACMDSHIKHAFTFTPANSIMVETDDANEVERLFNALAEGGEVLMELGEYPFSKKYGWTNDRYGVSWQLFMPLQP